MAVHELAQASEVKRLTQLVSELQAECDKLRASLAKAESDRDLYLKAVYAHARGTLHFEDVDIPALEKASAGPVQVID